MIRKKQPTLYLIEIQLREAILPVWRIIEVNKSITLHELHATIQIAMGWNSSHLYEFTLDETHYVDFVTNEPLADGDYADSRTTKLSDVLLASGEQLTYLYDYGDYWEHLVLLKGVANDSQSFIRETPTVLASSMACPPEDIGGISAYNDLVGWKLNKVVPRNEDLMIYFKDFDIFKVDLTSGLFMKKAVRRLMREMDKD